MQRFRIEISGVVQGVGFRPHVWHVAHQLQLAGWVKNTSQGVLIEVQGEKASCFLEDLQKKLPKLANIDLIDFHLIPNQANEEFFKILKSETSNNQTNISPDTAICRDCLGELFEPASRYHHYPFLNCTHCGPRLSIIEALPYDRQSTSMREFALCEDCLSDYNNPRNRRFHAQPTACKHCGPQLSHSLEDISAKIQQGKIIALKGVGGYQLICDAHNENAIVTLRKRKNRQEKPLALMMLNTKSIANFAKLNTSAITLLENDARPIVVLQKESGSLPNSLAPGLNCLGIMLPSTPLHYLLFYHLLGCPTGKDWLNECSEIALVVTSANISGEPLITDDIKAQSQLGAISDLIVSYNRNIVTRLDDSVVHALIEQPVFIRQARGYVPHPIKLPHAIPETLALGGHLKNTICITRGDQAYVSQHIGNMDNQATIEFYHETLEYMLRFLDVKPKRVACDLHPDFYTSRLAHTFDLPCYLVQHHHAHLQAVMAEYALDKPALALVLDGYGYGEDGGSWGGELFCVERTNCQRIGYFQPLPQPGGEVVIRQPWRMASAVLAIMGKQSEIATHFRDHSEAIALENVLSSHASLPLTSSCGRLFDAVSALLGICEISTYEGQAAMQMENLVTQLEVMTGGWKVDGDIFSMFPLLEHLSSNLAPVKGANLFHGTLIAGLSDWLCGTARERQIDTVLFSGGCFLNKVLSQGLMNSLTKRGLSCFLPRQLPVNDGGLSLGQAWMAGRL